MVAPPLHSYESALGHDAPFSAAIRPLLSRTLRTHRLVFEAAPVSVPRRGLTLHTMGALGGHCDRRRDNAADADSTSRATWWTHVPQDRVQWRAHEQSFIETRQRRSGGAPTPTLCNARSEKTIDARGGASLPQPRHVETPPSSARIGLDSSDGRMAADSADPPRPPPSPPHPVSL